MLRCPFCVIPLKTDTGSIIDFEKGLISEPIFFCSKCGFDTSIEMKTSIFTTPRRGLMGKKSLGADYMLQVTERARRLEAAASIRNPRKISIAAYDRQQRLPGF